MSVDRALAVVGCSLLMSCGATGASSPADAAASTPDSGAGNADVSPGGGADPPCVDVRRYERGQPLPVVALVTGSEPPLGGCVHDPALGTTACKIADATSFPTAESGGVVRPVYSRWPIDSLDGALAFLVKEGETPPGSGRGQSLLLRTGTHELVRVVSEISCDESAELRWDGGSATTLLYREDCQLRTIDALTGKTALVHDFATNFPGCARILNDVEGDASRDGRLWAFMVQGPYDGAEFPMTAIVTYDRAKDAIVGTLDLARYSAMGGVGGTLPRPNMVDVAPSGGRVVVLFPRTDRGDTFDGPHAFDPDFTKPVKVCNDETHSGWAYGAGGEELWVCQVDNTNWPAAEADTIAVTDVRTGKTDVVLFHQDLGWDVGGFHFGRFVDPAMRGWIFVSTYSETGVSQSWARNMAFMVEAKPWKDKPRIWRISQTHNQYPGADGYPREAYSPLSRDGRHIWWGADWPGGDGTVDTWAVDLPDRWWERIDEIPRCSP